MWVIWWLKNKLRRVKYNFKLSTDSRCAIVLSMITRNRILFIVGLWNVLLPFLGFPSYIRTVLIVLSGLAVIVLAFLYARDKRVVPKHTPDNSVPVREKEVVSDVFVENNGERFTDLKSILKHTKTF